MKPYGLMADLHFHNWSAFSHVISVTGVNTRLQIQLDEVRRCAEEVKKAKGDTIVIAGDVFHVRGSLAPTVLNPVLDLFAELVKDGMNIKILAGNHDLEGKHSERISSAITSLEKVGCRVFNMPHINEDANIMFVPWTSSIGDLKALLLGFEKTYPSCDLILHAPIDGVIPGLPEHGLSPEFLNRLGFKRVFSGHYHNHKDFGNNVYSIGASTHQTWSDVGSKAGFLIVGEDKVIWRSTRAPAFIDLHKDTPEEEVPLIVDGNYVRAKTDKSNLSEINGLREWLMEQGALGVVINAVREKKEERTETIKAGLTLEASVQSFIDTGEFKDKDKLGAYCAELLGKVVEL